MLTQVQIQNFKAWKDTGTVTLAPLTVIFGTNSSGKSSLGHLLLALKQTVQLADRKRALHLGDGNSLIDLGTFADCVHGHDLAQEIGFSLRWRLPKTLTVKNPLNPAEAFMGSELELSSVLRADKNGQPQTESFTYRLLQGQVRMLEAVHRRGDAGISLLCEPLKLVMAMGRKWPLEPPEKFYRFADRTLLRYQNADFLADFALQAEEMLERMYYLGPLRQSARRVYQWSGETPPHVGALGEHTIAALLAATEQGRRLNRGPKQKLQPFDVFIAGWLRDLGVIDSFRGPPGGRRAQGIRGSGTDPCQVASGQADGRRGGRLAGAAGTGSGFLFTAQFGALDGAAGNPPASFGPGQPCRRFPQRGPVQREWQRAWHPVDHRDALGAFPHAPAAPSG